eukprot:1334273-Ditylum_brightwellii.AAC.1
MTGMLEKKAVKDNAKRETLVFGVFVCLNELPLEVLDRRDDDGGNAVNFCGSLKKRIADTKNTVHATNMIYPGAVSSVQYVFSGISRYPTMAATPGPTAIPNAPAVTKATDAAVLS